MSMANEAEPILAEFVLKIHNSIHTHIRNNSNKPDFLDTLGLLLQALLGVVLRSGNYTQILTCVEFILSVEKHLSQEEDQKLALLLADYVKDLLSQIHNVEKLPKLQYQHSGCDLGGFEILKKLHFHKNAFYHNSLATDGEYPLPICVLPERRHVQDRHGGEHGPGQGVSVSTRGSWKGRRGELGVPQGKALPAQ